MCPPLKNVRKRRFRKTLQKKVLGRLLQTPPITTHTTTLFTKNPQISNRLAKHHKILFQNQFKLSEKQYKSPYNQYKSSKNHQPHHPPQNHHPPPPQNHQPHHSPPPQNPELPDIERELRRLFTMDSQASSFKYELIYDNDSKTTTSSKVMVMTPIGKRTFS